MNEKNHFENDDDVLKRNQKIKWLEIDDAKNVFAQHDLFDQNDFNDLKIIDHKEQKDDVQICQKSLNKVSHEFHQVNIIKKQNIIQDSKISITIACSNANENSEDISISIEQDQIENINNKENSKINDKLENKSDNTKEIQANLEEYKEEKEEKEENAIFNIIRNETSKNKDINEENKESDNDNKEDSDNKLNENNADDDNNNNTDNNKKNVNNNYKSNDKVSQMKSKNEKQLNLNIPSPPQKRQKTTFAEIKNRNKNYNLRNTQKSSRVGKSYSQSNIYNQKLPQNAQLPIDPTKNTTPNSYSRNGKILHSKTTPSSPKNFRNPKYGLFERSLKKPKYSDDDSDDFQNYTFSYSNYNKRPVVSNITSETNILNEVQKRKMRGLKENEDEIEEMKNHQFKVSDYSKMLAKRAIQKINEKKLQEKSKKERNSDYEYEPDDEELAYYQILPDDAELRKKKHIGKMPAYLSRVDTFNKEHKDIINTTKKDEIRNSRKSKK